MRLHAIQGLAATAVLAASLTVGTPVLAATSTAHSSSRAPAQAGSPGTVTVNTALGFGSAADAKSAHDKTAIPQQEEIFICDPITYGISGIAPVTGGNGETTGYSAPYVLQEECPIPMSMSASVNILDTTTNEVVDTDLDLTGFGEEVGASGDPVLPINSNFLGTYVLQMELFPGFEWIFGPPECIGIGTTTMICTFYQGIATPGSGS